MRKYGRYHIHDPNDFKMLRPRKKSKRNSRHWSRGPTVDQGSAPACVGYAGYNLFAASPIKQVVCEPMGLYYFAQSFDEWDGMNYEGTSVRGLMKACGPGRAGWITEYRFTQDMNVLIEHILEKGPVVFGTDWYEGMNETDSKGFIHPTGRLLGGHAYLGYGVNKSRGYISIKNSWGLDEAWDGKDTAKIQIGEFDKHCLQPEGEAVAPTEVRL